MQNHDEVSPRLACFLFLQWVIFFPFKAECLWSCHNLRLFLLLRRNFEVKEGINSTFFDLVFCVFHIRWAPLSREAEWSWPPRTITVSSVTPPSVLRLWPRLTTAGRTTPRGSGWRRLRVTRSRRYCRFLWGQCCVRLSLEKKNRKGSLLRSLTFEISFFQGILRAWSKADPERREWI